MKSRDYKYKGQCHSCKLVTNISEKSLSCIDCDIKGVLSDYKQAILTEQARADYFKSQYQELKYGKNIKQGV